MAGGRTKKYMRSDFSGGLQEAYGLDEFTERQNAIVKGFVFDSETQLRSQWTCQQMTRLSSTGPTEIGDYFILRTASGLSRIIAIDTAGLVWWASTPGAALTAFGISWTAVPGAGGEQGEVTPGSRFICEVPWGRNLAKYRSGVLVQPPKSAANTQPGWVAYILDDAGETPSLASIGSAYPELITETRNGVETVTGVATNRMPWSTCGSMWGDYLVLGDVFGSSTGKPAEFDASNKQRYTNGLWISATPAVVEDRRDYESFRIDQWDPRYGFLTIGTPETRITGLLPIDNGLLVFTTNSAEGDGLYLLRGYPPGLSADNEKTPTFKLEVVRGGLAALAGEPAQKKNRTLITWAEGGTHVLVDARGQVWTTNGAQASRMDIGPVQPTAAMATDGVAGFGQHLLLARGNRLLAFRTFGTDGCWTELVTPQASLPVTNMRVDGQGLYFLQGSTLYRYSMTAPNRGRVGSTFADLTVGTATVGSGEYDTELWHRVGLAISGAGTVKSVTATPGPALAGGVGYTQTLNKAFSGRTELVVPAGIGRAAEASATVVVAGDVTVGSVRLESISSVMKRG